MIIEIISTQRDEIRVIEPNSLRLIFFFFFFYTNRIKEHRTVTKRLFIFADFSNHVTYLLSSQTRVARFSQRYFSLFLITILTFTVLTLGAKITSISIAVRSL